MRRARWRRCSVLVALATAASSSGAHAQTEAQWWPEADVAWRAARHVRLFALGRVMAAEEANQRQRMLGLHADYLRLPRAFVRIGYRSVVSIPDTADAEHRALVEVTLSGGRGKLELSNRTRVEWRWIGPRYSWRLRDRLVFQYDAEMPWGGSLRPFLAIEAFYDSRYRAISRERYEAGISVPLGSVLVIELAYLRQEDGRATVPHVNVLRTRLSLAFGRGGD